MSAKQKAFCADLEALTAALRGLRRAVGSAITSGVSVESFDLEMIHSTNGPGYFSGPELVRLVEGPEGDVRLIIGPYTLDDGERWAGAAVFVLLTDTTRDTPGSPYYRLRYHPEPITELETVAGGTYIRLAIDAASGSGDSSGMEAVQERLRVLSDEISKMRKWKDSAGRKARRYGT